MTSNTHFDAIFNPTIKSFVNFIGHPKSNDFERNTDFGDIMQRAAGRTSENQNMQNRDNLFNTARTQTGRQNDAQQKSNETQANRAEVSTKPENPDRTSALDQTSAKSEEIVAKVVEKAEEVLNTIADKFEVTPEVVMEVLATLGLIPESLLDMKALSEVIVHLSGTDLLTLMTDEELYGNFTGLTDEVEPIINDLLDQTGLSPEEMKQLLDQLKSMEKAEVSQERLTESVNQTNEVAEQQATEPEQKITIMIERDGVITEITAKADENGNIKSTNEVVEIDTEPKVVAEYQEQPKQEGNQSGEKNNEGHEAILNNLLQNRTNTVEAKFEPIVLETPNTEQIMNQIMEFMKIKLTPEINSLEMQLHPASLGTVGVKINSAAGVITAQFTAQNETVRAAIESQIVELKENIRSQGIKVEAIEVNLDSQAFDSKLWQGKEENNQDEQNGKKNRRRINLSGLDELPEDLEGDEKLAAEMMIENGQTVDFSA